MRNRRDLTGRSSSRHPSFDLLSHRGNNIPRKESKNSNVPDYWDRDVHLHSNIPSRTSSEVSLGASSDSSSEGDPLNNVAKFLAQPFTWAAGGSRLLGRTLWGALSSMGRGITARRRRSESTGSGVGNGPEDYEIRGEDGPEEEEEFEDTTSSYGSTEDATSSYRSTGDDTIGFRSFEEEGPGGVNGQSDHERSHRGSGSFSSVGDEFRDRRSSTVPKVSKGPFCFV